MVFICNLLYSVYAVRLVVREYGTGSIRMYETPNLNASLNVTASSIFIHKENRTYVSNQIIVRMHDMFNVYAIANDYNLQVINRSVNGHVLRTQSAVNLLNIESALNRDERVIYAEILDAYDMEMKSCACSSLANGCTSDGNNVNLRCGCYDHLPSSNSFYFAPFCYVHDSSTCTSADNIASSSWITGTYFRDCDDMYPNEPDIRRQWYLNLIHWPVWDTNATGEGVTIAIVDDSFDLRHPEFDVLDGFSVDYIDDDNDPTTDSFQHGTAAGGLAVARQNNIGMIGVAPGAKVVGYRLLNYFTSADEQDAYTRDSNVIHIKSCSWGPYDDPHNVQGMSYMGNWGMMNAVNTGRSNLGTIFVFAAGNGGNNNNNCNNDGYANSMYTIAVTAVSARLERISYGEECACMIVSAPSSGNGFGIYTTDTVGSRGYSNSNYTSNFGGTSAAAPIVSGVVALMLQANPLLNWRDVRDFIDERKKE